MAPVVAAVAAVGSALSATSIAIGSAIGLTGVAAGIVGGAVVGGVLGAATSAIFGGEIEKGALFGAIGGAVAGGFSGANSINAANSAASGASAGASGASSGALGGASLTAAPSQGAVFGQLSGSTGYSLGADGILAGASQIADKVAPAASLVGHAGEIGSVIGNSASSDMAAFLTATKEASIAQTKWMAGTEAVKMGASALLDDKEDDALKLQREAIAASKIDLEGVRPQRVQGRFSGTTQAGSVSSYLNKPEKQGLLGGYQYLGGRGYDYAKRTA